MTLLEKGKEIFYDPEPMREYLKRTVLILNGLLFILGFMGFALGMALAFGTPSIKAVARPVIDGGLKNEKMLIKSDRSTPNPVANQYIGLIAPFGYAVFVLALFVIVLAVGAILAAIFDYKIIQTIYFIGSLVLSLVIALLIVLFLVLQGKVKYHVEDYLRVMMSQFKGEKGENDESVAWIFTQMEFKCCGVRNATDYEMLQTWTGADPDYKVNREFPFSCCKVDSKFRFISEDCIHFPSPANSYANTGCLHKVYRKLLHLIKAPALVLAACVFVNLVAVVFTWTLLKYNKEEDDPMPDADAMEND
jgi:hypothetical protein